MRLLLLVTIFFLLLLCNGFSQIPNGGFEDWITDLDSNYNPVGWETTNSYPTINVEPFSPGWQGNFAMKVKTVDLGFGFSFPGIAILETPYNFAQAPAKLSAYIKSNIVPGDIAYIMVALMKGDSVIAAIDSCTFKIDTTISQFTYREFPLALQSNLVPDSLTILVMSGLLTGHVGTELIIDEISFSGATSSKEYENNKIPGTFVLNQNYPNPFNPATTIKYSIPENSYVTLKIYDILGNEIETLVNEEKYAGSYEVEFGSNLIHHFSSGTYFYRLTAGSLVETKKMILLK